jgi:DNA-binding FadR family transcriptional regulator
MSPKIDDRAAPVAERQLGDPAREPLAQPQLYELIAQRLTEWIRAGRLSDGERLPPERELALHLDVSRSSVREAIGALQVEGLLETRRGSGSFVAAGAGQRVRSAVPGIASIAMTDVGPFAVLQSREVLEPGIVRAAAERAQPSARAEELLGQMDRATDPEDPAARAAWSDADRLFHRELAVMSGNPVLVSLAEHVAALMDQPLWRRLRDDLISVPGRTVTHVAEHRLILQSVVEGEPDAAAFQALHHVQRVQRQMRD